MPNKKTKIWGFAFALTLMAVGGASSYYASQNTLYKGLEPLGTAYSSILNADEIQPDNEKISRESEQADSSELQNLSKNSAAGAQANLQNTNPQPRQEFIAPIASACGSDERPILSQSKIIGCAPKQDSQKTRNRSAENSDEQTDPMGPAPKIVITAVQNQSCEQQEKFTYTGPDRPDLAYGACIDCDTQSFILNNGKCGN